MRYVAFLRSINVGGHTVKMDALRKLFESMGFAKVETFIASGNVAFSSASKNAKALEKKIETKLKEALGYDVATFVRSTDELSTVAKHKPFDDVDVDARLYIAFVAEPVPKMIQEKLLAYKSKADSFHFHKREVYWLCRIKFNESMFSGPLLEKILGVRATIRNSTTVRKLAEKHSA